MELPNVCIGIITYDRPKEIRETIAALLDLVVYPSDKLWWVVSDDSTPGSYLKNLKGVLPKDRSFLLSTPTRGGWGRNANFLRKSVQTKYLFMIEDDYVLKKKLDLEAAVALMEAKPDIGMVRFRGTGGTHLVLHQLEADIDLPRYRDGLGLPGKITYLQIDSGSPSLYIYSNGPHLINTETFIPFYGPYPEGRKLGETEEAYAHTVKDGMRRPGAPAVVILPEWVSMHFDHIGKSYQNTELDGSY